MSGRFQRLSAPVPSALRSSAVPPSLASPAPRFVRAALGARPTPPLGASRPPRKALTPASAPTAAPPAKTADAPAAAPAAEPASQAPFSWEAQWWPVLVGVTCVGHLRAVQTSHTASRAQPCPHRISRTSSTGSTSSTDILTEWTAPAAPAAHRHIAPLILRPAPAVPPAARRLP
jgi:hypothetical protein